MCAHYTVFSEAEILEMRIILEELSKKFGAQAVKTGEINPTDIAPVLTLADDRLVPSPARFGLPRKDGKGLNLNARSDNALTVWRRSLFTRRCVVPSTGFYEWLHVGKKPTDQFLFRRPGEKMLYMAGMLDRITDKDGVTPLSS